MRLIQLVSLFIIVIFSSCSRHNPISITHGYGTSTGHAMVVSAHPFASDTGAGIMAQGGNAIDAAVATEFALAVCFPAAGNIGGGGFMVIRLSDGTVNSINYREMAPLASTRDMFLDSTGNVIEGLSLNTHLSSGVPGTVYGLLEAHKKYGKMPLARLIQPAINLALKGFPVTERQAVSLNNMKEVFLSRNKCKVAFVKEAPWQAGDTLKQPELAETLIRIRDHGKDGFYSGKTAQLIVNECTDGNGIITYDDLKNYRSEWEKPVTITYHGYEIITMPPPSSGGVALCQMLKMIEPFHIGTMGFHSTQTMHLMIEAERRAYADRAEFLGDPDFFKIPVDGLLNDNYLKNRMSNFDINKASDSEEIIHVDPSGYESEETTHYSIVDQAGNAVSGTTTLNNLYGSGIVVEGAGFLLNDEMDDFSSKPGHPNMFGLVGGMTNSIQPGKRMLSSMTPTIITKNNRLFMVVGSPGGATIITTVFQVIINVVDFNMSVQDAVNAGRFHHQWLPDKVYYESERMDTMMMNNLKLMGHKVESRGVMGRADVVCVSPDGHPEAGADNRGDDASAGF